jgi:membrane protein implicated in regulation of membrane protease activity
MREQTPDLNEQLNRVEALCPAFLARPLHFLREPRLRWLRMGVGLLLIVGGLLFFLPILVIEMLPIGLMLVAIDVPFLRGPVARMIDWIWRLAVQVLSIWQVISARMRQSWRRPRLSRSRTAADDRAALSE